MLRRFLGLRQRYLNQAVRLSGQPGPILDASGAAVGHITEIAWTRQQFSVSGHAGPGPVSLRAGQAEVTRDLPIAGTVFQLEMPWPAAELDAGRIPLLALPGVPEIALKLHARRRTRARLTLQLLWHLVVLVPALVRWATRHDPDSKARIKARLGLNLDQTPSGPVPAALFADTDAPPPGDAGGRVCLVLPVYNAADLTRECLARIARHTDLDWTLIAVEDASCDPTIRPMLRSWAATRKPGQVILIEHATNQGFVASVNAAFAALQADRAHCDCPVVLLNTDALVPPGWASRLVAPILADPAVASVTPMSNDAEIFSVPAICTRQSLQPGQADAIDRTAARLAPGAAQAQAPTGVGFCMALSPTFLARVPQFDPAFGRGYGEEVDWCQKVRALGGRHLGTAALFVEHRGGASFGTAQKAALISRNGQIISQRYPSYDAEVQDFLTVDPLRGARLALAIAWAGSARPGAPVPVYLAHAMGGGADHWLRARIAQDTARGQPSVVLRVGGSARWQLEVCSPQGTTAGWTDDFALIEALLEPLAQRRIVYSCGVGDRDPFAIPQTLEALQRGPSDEIEVLFHDYLPVAPSMTLLDGDGRYHGAITPHKLAGLSPGAARSYGCVRPDGQQIDLGQWQQRWGALLERAAEIRVFSASSAAIVAEVWPAVADRITVTPHALAVSYPPLAAPDGGAPPVLGVLGNIAPHKGAALVQTLAGLSEAQRGGRMVLIGDIDPAFPLPRSCPVHSRYAPADIPLLARHYGITHWLVPSLWPETFSFTTHEALCTGLPVLAFDIGAQGDAVRAAANGMALRYGPDLDVTALCDRVIAGFRKGG